ncbi:hypothetical protein GPLA_1171 [Paraglaciecola polaris LMG 21857]|uniref:Uncharacterized protein n=1 Tax=Paraglaciecola polaris LMG 21857 TaxID=1129793 RepID=K6Z7A2_9ALTE|nr:hypothetical protein GPLA_1171 [Paraglaciecola polaris LMG 21857]
MLRKCVGIHNIVTKGWQVSHVFAKNARNMANLHRFRLVSRSLVGRFCTNTRKEINEGKYEKLTN